MYWWSSTGSYIASYGQGQNGFELGGWSIARTFQDEVTLKMLVEKLVGKLAGQLVVVEAEPVLEQLHLQEVEQCLWDPSSTSGL